MFTSDATQSPTNLLGLAVEDDHLRVDAAGHNARLVDVQVEAGDARLARAVERVRRGDVVVGDLALLDEVRWGGLAALLAALGQFLHET